MWGKCFLIIALSLPSIILAQDQKNFDIPQQTVVSNCSIAPVFMMFLLQLEKIATEGYCKNNTSTLPIVCASCKQRRLFLGEFSACLMLQASKKKYDDFLKLLISPDTKEAEMAAFVLEAMKSLQYACTNCKSMIWTGM